MENPQFKVPKLAIRADVAFPRTPSQQLHFFLADHAASHSGFERPSDVLNGDDAFLPTTTPTGELVLLNLDGVVTVDIDLEHEFGGAAVDTELEDLQGVVRFDVECILTDGSVRRGRISFLHPEGQRRLQNGFNGAGRFVCLRGIDTVCFLNKSYVSRVREVEPALED